MRGDFGITVPEVDTVVESVLAAGAYGAGMTGGGFGGCVLALVDAATAETVASTVAGAYAERRLPGPDPLHRDSEGGSAAARLTTGAVEPVTRCRTGE
ncbi:hypothetical protein [Plantactinospora sp. WMMB782]|uniref:hypothetical protein n=1 Tax=Plantactinospora sp. WMMB782 TaxID=3404121 RepID=UPI003B965A78